MHFVCASPSTSSLKLLFIMSQYLNIYYNYMFIVVFVYVLFVLGDNIDPLNFDRFVKIVDANNVQTAHNKLLTGSATNVSQFLKSQIRIGHLRDAIPQGDSNEPIRALDSRTQSSNGSLSSSRLALSPRSENGDESMTSGLSNQSNVSGSAWLKIKVENWFREVSKHFSF